MTEVPQLIVDALNLLGLASDATRKKTSWQQTLARIVLAVVVILAAVYWLYPVR